MMRKRGRPYKRSQTRSHVLRSKSVDAPRDYFSRQTFHSFIECMNDPIMTSGYYQHLCESYCDEILACYRAIIVFERKYDSYTPLQRLHNAKKILDTFVSPHGEQTVNTSGEIRQDIFSIFERELGEREPEIPKDIFLQLREDLICLMSKDSFLKFLNTKLYAKSADKQCQFHEFESQPTFPAEDISPSQWDILMTGSVAVTFEEGEAILKEGTVNSFYYRLESGVLHINKKIAGTETTIAVIDQPGSVLGDISSCGSMPATASVVAGSTCVLQRLHSDFMLFLFFTTKNGPDLGIRFFKYLGNKLSKLLANITALERENIFANRTYVANFMGNIKPEQGSSHSISHDILHHRFRTLPMNESVITTTECYWKNKRKSTLYVTSKHLCIFSSSFGQKHREVIGFEDIAAFNTANANSLEIYTFGSQKPFNLRFEKESTLKNTLMLLTKTVDTIQNIIPEIEKNRNNNAWFSRDNSAATFTNLSEEEWEILGNNSTSNTPYFPFIYFPGEEIVKEGVTANHRVYRIRSGQCRVEKMVPNPRPGEPAVITLATIYEGDIFGEISFFNNIRSSATVIADTFVQLQIIDCRHLARLQTQNYGVLVTKFYYFVCSFLAKCVNEREQSGWSRQDKKLLKSGDYQDKKLLPLILQNGRRDATEFANLVRLIEGPTGEIDKTYQAVIENGFLNLCAEDLPCISIDLLISFAVGDDSSKQVSLISDEYTFILEPLTDSTTIWINRLIQSSYAIQTQCIQSLSDKFFNVARRYNKLVLSDKVLVQLKPNMPFKEYIIQLNLDYVYVYAPGVEEPVTSTNILFGTAKRRINLEVVITSDVQIKILFKDEPQLSQWITAIYSIKEQLFAAGITQFQANR